VNRTERIIKLRQDIMSIVDTDTDLLELREALAFLLQLVDRVIEEKNAR
jgi:hypothetical protein